MDRQKTLALKDVLQDVMGDLLPFTIHGETALGLGIALLVIGYIGVVIGRIIQAAVSRQREFLADASGHGGAAGVSRPEIGPGQDLRVPYPQPPEPLAPQPPLRLVARPAPGPGGHGRGRGNSHGRA